MADKDGRGFTANPATTEQSDERDMKLTTPMIPAYEKPNKKAEETVHNARKRLSENVKAAKAGHRPHEDTEHSRQAKVVGQLKAAESRNRNRLMRLRYQAMRAYEINQLINSQPTARDAIRLEVFLPPRQDTRYPPDPLDRTERARVETILRDEMGLTINRTI